MTGHSALFSRPSLTTHMRTLFPPSGLILSTGGPSVPKLKSGQVPPVHNSTNSNIRTDFVAQLNPWYQISAVENSAIFFFFDSGGARIAALANCLNTESRALRLPPGSSFCFFHLDRRQKVFVEKGCCDFAKDFTGTWRCRGFFHGGSGCEQIIRRITS